MQRDRSQWALGWDMWRAQRGGHAALKQRAQVRLRALVEYARAHSPLLSDLYSGLPRRGWQLAEVPRTSKTQLMADFDLWLTDLTVKRAAVEEFIADPANVGRPLGPAAFVCTSSGTTGVPGLYVHDSRAADVYWVNPIVRGYGFWFGPQTLRHFMQHGGREAQVIGTGAHFGGAVWAQLAQQRNEVTRKALAVFPAQLPVAELVAGLNEFDPAVIAGYSTSIEQLAAERMAGRLHVEPTLVVTSGEGISEVGRQRVAGAFGCMVRQSYAASETLFMAHSCAHGWLHLSNDWYLLEPVASDGSPTPVGELSHTVLVTNLANRLQPIIRYDLGDAVLMRPDTCDCGSPLPAFRVAGRSGGLLTFTDAAGDRVAISPMVIGAALELVPSALRAQVVQETLTRVALHFEVVDGKASRGEVGDGLRQAVSDALCRNGLANVEVFVAATPAQHAAPSAKFKHVVGLEASVGQSLSVTQSE